MVEFALILPLFLVVLAGIVDFGFLFQRYEVVTNAAREGARIGALPGYGQDVIRARVRTYVQEGLALTNPALDTVLPVGNVTVTNPPHVITLAGGGSVTVPTVQVQVAYNHTFLLIGPMLSLIGGSFGNTMTINATSRMRLEVPAAGS